MFAVYPRASRGLILLCYIVNTVTAAAGGQTSESLPWPVARFMDSASAGGIARTLLFIYFHPREQTLLE